MKSPENFESEAESSTNKSVSEFGIGHMPKETYLSLEKIRPDIRQEVVDTYNSCSEKIKSLVLTIDNLIKEINVEKRSPEVFNSIVSGISEALFKTTNQIMYHSEFNPEESLTAFDELSMVLESVNKSLISPQILNKKEYSTSAIYELAPLENVEGYDVESFNTLFSKDHIAFNLTSRPKYQDSEKTIKSGVRLDYGPLYKETDRGVDKTKTEWQTSVDISGYYLDKIMNKYSPRGHHFTKMFDYKIHLLMESFADQMEQRFDKSLK